MNWDRIALVGVIGIGLGVGIGAEVRGQDQFLPPKAQGQYLVGGYGLGTLQSVDAVWIVAPDGTPYFCIGTKTNVTGGITPNTASCITATGMRRKH